MDNLLITTLSKWANWPATRMFVPWLCAANILVASAPDPRSDGREATRLLAASLSPFKGLPPRSRRHYSNGADALLFASMSSGELAGFSS